MNSLAIEQDIYNLKKDCEDKDVIIKELTSLLHSSDIAGSKVFCSLFPLATQHSILLSLFSIFDQL